MNEKTVYIHVQHIIKKELTRINNLNKHRKNNMIKNVKTQKQQPKNKKNILCKLNPKKKHIKTKKRKKK